MANRLAGCALLGSAALALVACGSERSQEPAQARESAIGTPASGQAQADPCALVSKEEMAAITGEAVVAADADGNTCSYQTDDPASTLQVEVHPTGGAGQMQVARSAAGVLGEIGGDMKGSSGARRDAGELLSEGGPAPAIGDQAFYGANQQLNVLKGDTYFSVLPPVMRSRMAEGSPLLSADRKRQIAAAVAEKIAAKVD